MTDKHSPTSSAGYQSGSNSFYTAEVSQDEVKSGEICSGTIRYTL